MFVQMLQKTVCLKPQPCHKSKTRYVNMIDVLKKVTPSDVFIYTISCFLFNLLLFVQRKIITKVILRLFKCQV